MAFKVPTLAEVSSTIENGFSSALYGKSGSLRVGVLKVLSKVVAGACYMPILFCNYIFKNSFIDSCDVENLVRFGGWYNLPHKVASHASGKIIVYLQSFNIPRGSILVDEESGLEYELQEDMVSPSGYTGNIVALGAGSEYNLPANKRLKLRDSDIDYNIRTEVISGGALYEVSVNGIVEQWGEDVESYRDRLKYRRQHQPMGGAVSDYIQWAERFSQVTNAYVPRTNFPKTNSVCVFCADFNNSSVSLNETELEEVRNYICDTSRKPATADVNVVSVSAPTIALTIVVPNIGGSTKSDIVNVLKSKLKGYGFGKYVSTDLVKKILLENGIVDSCSVTQLFVDGRNYTANGYYLKLSASGENVVGEIVNINSIESNLKLVVG